MKKELKVKNQKVWNEYVEKNKDDYGKCCIDVARQVMKNLDKLNEPLEYGYYPNPKTAHAMICIADDEIDAGGITGFMAGCVAQMIFECHKRGEEFKESFNGKNKSKGVINPALFTISD